MNTAHTDAKSPSHPSDRLDRLEDFLTSDPSNRALLLDAFDVALAAGRYDNAERHARSAIDYGLDLMGWRYRLACLRVAQNCFVEARAMFNDLQVECGPDPMITYNLASMDFADGDFTSCINGLGVWMDGEASAEGKTPAKLSRGSLGALQVLWLRALHHSGELERAWAWLENRRALLGLSSAAAGIACMIAVDSGRLDQVEVLAGLASSDPTSRQEVLLAFGTSLLARQDASGARQQLQQALSLSGTNGRIWSALGFVELLDQQVDQAVQNFERSVQLMPKHAGTWIGLGWSRMLAQSNLAGVREAFEAALDLDRNFAESHGCLAVVMAMEGYRQEAAHHIELADRLDRGNMAARYARLVLDGKASNPATVRRLAHRLLGELRGSLVEG